MGSERFVAVGAQGRGLQLNPVGCSRLKQDSHSGILTGLCGDPPWRVCVAGAFLQDTHIGDAMRLVMY